VFSWKSICHVAMCLGSTLRYNLKGILNIEGVQFYVAHIYLFLYFLHLVESCQHKLQIIFFLRKKHFCKLRVLEPIACFLKGLSSYPFSVLHFVQRWKALLSIKRTNWQSLIDLLCA